MKCQFNDDGAIPLLACKKTSKYNRGQNKLLIDRTKELRCSKQDGHSTSRSRATKVIIQSGRKSSEFNDPAGKAVSGKSQRGPNTPSKRNQENKYLSNIEKLRKSITDLKRSLSRSNSFTSRTNKVIPKNDSSFVFKLPLDRVKTAPKAKSPTKSPLKELTLSQKSSRAEKSSKVVKSSKDFQMHSVSKSPTLLSRSRPKKKEPIQDSIVKSSHQTPKKAQKKVLKEPKEAKISQPKPKETSLERARNTSLSEVLPFSQIQQSQQPLSCSLSQAMLQAHLSLSLGSCSGQPSFPRKKSPFRLRLYPVDPEEEEEIKHTNLTFA